MSLSLHNLKKAEGSTKRRKRVGRGNSSGHGTYCTRGLKGQRSRSGGKGGLKRLGLKSLIIATPKKRGFKSAKPKNQVITLSDLSNNFKDGELVNPKKLLSLGLINNDRLPVKILNSGELKIKGLKIEGVKISKSVEKKLNK